MTLVDSNQTEHGPVAGDAFVGRSARSGAAHMVAWLLPAQVIQTLLNMAVGIVAARTLGPAGLGDLSFVLATVALLEPAIVTHRQVLTRDLVREPDERGAILGTGIALGMLSSLIAMAVGVGFAFVSGQGHTSTIAIAVGVVSLVGVALASTETLLQVEHRSRDLAVARTAPALGGSVGKILAVVGGLGVVGFVAARSIQAFFNAALCVWFIRRSGDRVPRWSVDRLRFRRLFRDSWPLLMTAVSIAVYMSFDQIMLRFLASRAETGVYASAVRLSEASLLIPMVLLTATAPTLVSSFSTDMTLYRRQTQRFINILTTVAAVIALVGGVLAVPAISLLYGKGFAGAAPVLLVLLVANIFMFQSVASSVWIVNEGLQRSFMKRAMFGALINVGLNFALIPRFGAVGAAGASVVAYAFASTFGVAIDRRTRPLALMLVRAWHPRAMAYAIRHELPQFVGEFRRSKTAGGS